MLLRQAETEGDIGDVDSCEAFLGRLASAKTGGDETVSLVLLDPLGHSKIMHDSATSRSLTDEEVRNSLHGPQYTCLRYV